MSPLFGVLLKFCKGTIALAAEVREMYNKLRLPASNQPAMRFLWGESPSEEPSVYQFQRPLFGEVSAPSRATIQ